MTSRVDRVNRVLFLVLGVLCVGGGVAALLVGFSVFGDDVAGRYLLPRETRRFAERNHGWFWLAIGIGLGIIALLALRWLIAQASMGRLVALQLEAERSRGGTRLVSSAVTDALCEEIEGYRGVARARGRLLGRQDQPTLRLDVFLDETADLGKVRSRIEGTALAHARQTTDLDDLSAEVRLRVAATERRRVV